MTYRTQRECALCGHTILNKVLQLASTPLANELLTSEDIEQEHFPLTLDLCPNCGHLQLREVVDPARLFKNYVYVSGTSSVFVEHFKDYATKMVDRFGLGSESLVVDIGSNDGTLLKQFTGCKILGVDPAEDIAHEANMHGVPTLTAFFDKYLAHAIVTQYGMADLVTANNVFAHTEHLRSFALAVKDLLGPEGVFVFEVSYRVDVLEKMLFDTIYHEHLAYHSVTSLIPFFESLGLRLFDVERIPSHGGSLRGYVCRAEGPYQRFDSVDDLMHLEADKKVFNIETYELFKKSIEFRGALVRQKLESFKRRGCLIAGFGAPAKLTTLMHEFRLTRQHIDFIVDDSPWKQGLYTAGTKVPIVSSSELHQQKPEWCVVFAWNFAESIMKKHWNFGGKFMIPLPDYEEV